MVRTLHGPLPRSCARLPYAAGKTMDKQMLVKLLLLVLLALLAALLLFFLYSKKRISVKGSILAAVCCVLVLGAAGVCICKKNEKTPGAPADPISDREEGNRKMDMIMWYDIDTGPTTNGRPQKGWWPLNPQHPGTVAVSGNFRTTTPLMGLYDQRIRRRQGAFILDGGARMQRRRGGLDELYLLPKRKAGRRLV